MVRYDSGVSNLYTFYELPEEWRITYAEDFGEDAEFSMYFTVRGGWYSTAEFLRTDDVNWHGGLQDSTCSDIRIRINGADDTVAWERRRIDE